MPDPSVLTAQPRQKFGNRVKGLRRNAAIPANLITAGKASRPLQVDEHAMATYVRRFGRSGLVELDIAGDRELALVDDVSIHAVSRRLLHVVFRHVDAQVAVTVNIPVEFAGEAPADARSEMFVVRLIDSVSITCLPRVIPAHISIGLENLVDPGDMVVAGDLVIGEGIELQTEIDTVLARVERSRLADEDVETDGEEEEDLTDEAFVV